MTPQELDRLAHQMAYATARSDIECMTRPEVVPPTSPSIDHRWYDLSAPIKDAFERQSVADAILYLDARGLLTRHRQQPYLVRVEDAPAEHIPATGLRLEPMDTAFDGMVRAMDLRSRA